MGSSSLSLKRIVPFTLDCETWERCCARLRTLALLQARSSSLDPSTILGAHHAHHASKRDMSGWTADSNEALCLQLGLSRFSGLLVTDSLVSESGRGL